MTFIANKSLVYFFLAKITRPNAPLLIILIKRKSVIFVEWATNCWSSRDIDFCYDYKIGVEVNFISFIQ